jgi:hypothetical protein
MKLITIYLLDHEWKIKFVLQNVKSHSICCLNILFIQENKKLAFLKTPSSSLITEYCLNTGTPGKDNNIHFVKY